MDLIIFPATAYPNSTAFKKLKLWMSPTKFTADTLPGEPTIYEPYIQQQLPITPPYFDKEFFIMVGYITADDEVFYSGCWSVRAAGPDTKKLILNDLVVGSGQYGKYISNWVNNMRPDPDDFNLVNKVKLNFVIRNTNLVFDGDIQYALTNNYITATNTINDVYHAGYMLKSGTKGPGWGANVMASLKYGEIEQGNPIQTNDVAWTMRVPTFEEFKERYCSFWATNTDNGKRYLAGGAPAPDDWFMTSTPNSDGSNTFVGVCARGHVRAIGMNEPIGFAPIFEYKVIK